MGNRQTHQERERSYGDLGRRNQTFPEFEEYEQREEMDSYRGRASYEQQSRSGTGGRSGMWDQYVRSSDPREHEIEEMRRRQRDFDRAQSQTRHPAESRGRSQAAYSNDPERARGYDRERGYTDAGEYARMSGLYGFDEGRYVARDWGGAPTPQRRGRGPKGYTRSDQRIREDVCDRLCEQENLDASEVEVAVAGGEVTLTGTVPDRQSKFRIEAIADRVTGVTDIDNQIRIHRGLPSQ